MHKKLSVRQKNDPSKSNYELPAANFDSRGTLPTVCLRLKPSAGGWVVELDGTKTQAGRYCTYLYYPYSVFILF